MIRVDVRPRKRNAPRPAEKSAPGFLQWLRGRGCVVCFVGNRNGETGRVEAAHVDYAGGKGIGTKVADRHAIPLCGGPAGCHATQHRIGWKAFERAHNLDALEAAEQFWRAWPGRIAWERKLEAGK